jgi:hypothetical protein
VSNDVFVVESGVLSLKPCAENQFLAFTTGWICQNVVTDTDTNTTTSNLELAIDTDTSSANYGKLAATITDSNGDSITTSWLDLSGIYATRAWVTNEVADALSDYYTKDEIVQMMSSNATAVLQKQYPVGALYMTTLNQNPATTLGFGTWEAYGQGRALVSNNGNTVPSSCTTVAFNATGAHDTSWSDGCFGGSAPDRAEHSHTTSGTAASAGSHTHGVQGYSRSVYTLSGSGTGLTQYTGTKVGLGSWTIVEAGAHTHTVSGTAATVTASGANYQPSIAIYVWRRKQYFIVMLCLKCVIISR